MDKETIDILTKTSVAFNAGVQAAKLNIPLRRSVLKNLRPCTPQYDDFLCGYDLQKNQ